MVGFVEVFDEPHHRQTALGSSELKFNLTEVVLYLNPVTRLEFEDMNDDSDEEVDPGGELAQKAF